MSTLTIDTPRVFAPFLKPSRYKAAHGGRGSGKSHFFGGLGIEYCMLYPGFRLLCVRELQNSLKQSVKRLIEDKIQQYALGGYFQIMHDRIITPGDGVIVFQGMQDHTAESVKSLESFHAAWVEEAQTMSARSLEFLRPTIRNAHPLLPKSELWFTWNPRNQNDAVDKFFRTNTAPEDAIIQQVNYNDNPYFPLELEQERQHDLKYNASRYAHIWLGAYEPQAEGAIFDQATIEANRIQEAPVLSRILVSIDPAISAEAHSDEHGIIVGGLGTDKRAYLLADRSLRGGPRQWARAAVAAYHEFDADGIVVERNQGGDMVAHTLRSEAPNIRIIEVTATKGKHVRAEPISALYSQNRVAHIGHLSELERQLCLFTAAGYEGHGSPDRADAAIWLLTELFPRIVTKAARPAHEAIVPSVNSSLAWMA